MMRTQFVALSLSLTIYGALEISRVWADDSVNKVICSEFTSEQVNQMVMTQIDSWKGALLGLDAFSLPTATNSPEQPPEKSELLVGKPLQVDTITLASLQNYVTQGNFESVLIPREIWYVPVLTTANNPHLLEVQCQQGNLNIVSAGFNQIAQPLNTLSQQVNLELTKNWIVSIEETKRLFLAVAVSTDTTIIYPLVTFPNQYANLKPIDNLGGYRDSEVLLLISTEFLKTANAVNITPDLNVHIPVARYENPGSAGTERFWVDFKYLPNSEHRLLFEATYGLAE